MNRAERLDFSSAESEKLLEEAASAQIGNGKVRDDYLRLSRFFFAGEIPEKEELERLKGINWKENCDPVIFSFVKGTLKDWEEGSDNLHLTVR